MKTTTNGQPPVPGYEDAPAPGPIGPNGQHRAYWVLSEEERAKGFVRPVRRIYRHVGPPGPKYPLRDLTPEEQIRFNDYDKFEDYPDGSSMVGRYWTKTQLEKIGKGCGGDTTMGVAIAETYARQPGFYGSTFCVHCKVHLPVGEMGEFVWDDGTRVGT